MAYQIEKTGDTSYAVKKGGKVHMRVSGPVRGQPPRRVGDTPQGPDVEYAMEIAARAVRYVRQMLPLGAFNNQMLIRGRYRYLTNNVSPRWLAARAETMYAALAFRQDEPRDPVTQMAARMRATLTVRGGVCSLMAYVTAGYLTTIAKRGTKIVVVFDGTFDHEYVVLYYGTSPYVVADPWVGTSYVCLWDDCAFPPHHVSVHTVMEIGETLRLPYGVVFTDQEVQTARREAEIDLIRKPPKNQILPNPEHQSLDQRDKYPWFHMENAYTHPDNLKAGHQREYRRVVGPEEWGTAVARPQPKHTSDQRDALDWADNAATLFAKEFH